MKVKVYRYQEEHNGETYWCHYSVKATVKPLGLKNEELVQEFDYPVKER